MELGVFQHALVCKTRPFVSCCAELSTTMQQERFFGQVPVVSNEPLARDTWLLRLDAPAVARTIWPGQFVMLRIPGCQDPLLGRAFALWDTQETLSGGPRYLELGYLVVGKMTRAMRNLHRGQKVELWGPLGNGFSEFEVDHLVLVAGGIGQTPFVALTHAALHQRSYGHPARRYRARKVTLCYGTRSAELLAGVEHFQRLGVEVLLSTDDGTAGHRGLVTEVFQKLLPRLSGTSVLVIACGPEPMMVQTAQLALQHQLPCWLSLEAPMACGIGICCSCVVPVRRGQGWDYCRSCLQGPVFDAQQLCLEQMA